ncbi:MAG: cobalamin B12-binding domain-containing protein, partial [Candidatus Omnitrophica bacterium]|nr:cobalamin B12-binding domain-containing protein [Candidatus Omnitrophota bacterium]
GERKHCTPPLGMAYLASNLLKHDFEVEILDILAEGYHQEQFTDPFIIYGLTLEQTMERVRKAQPDLIGVSCLFSNRAKESFELIRAIKAEFPDLPIVMGGQHPSGLPLEVMKNSDVDFVMIGEADLSFVQLLYSMNGAFPLEEVPGLYYKQDGQIKNTLSGRKPAVTGEGWDYFYLKDFGNPREIGELAYPAWDLFPMEAYWNSEVRIGGGDIVREKFAVMVSTRGCPHVCDFCTSPLMGGFKGYRMRTNEDVVKEIRWLVETYGVGEVQFLDDNFFVSKPRVKRLLKVLAEEFPETVFSVPAGTEVNALDFEVIDLMAKANIHKVSLAVEAGDQEVQNARVDKKVNVGRVPEIVEYIRSKGMETRALFMIGFPDETRQQIQRTVDLALSLPVDDFYISICTPLPGTPLYDECVRRGLLYEDFDVNDLRYSIANIKLPDVSREELEEIRRNVWLHYKQNQTSRHQYTAIKRPFKEFKTTTAYEYAGFKEPPKTFRESPSSSAVTEKA